jgi:hypothetical protein
MAGFSGYACTECAEGYYRQDLTCRSCSGNDNRIIPYFIVAVIVLLLLLLSTIFLNSLRLSFVVVSIMFLQQVITAANSGLQSLPASFAALSEAVSFGSIINFDLTMIRSGCDNLPAISFLTIFWSTFLFVVFGSLILVGGSYCRAKRTRLVPLSASPNNNNNSVAQDNKEDNLGEGLDSMKLSRLFQHRYDQTFWAASSSDIFLVRAYQAVTAFFCFVFLRLLTTCIWALNCVSREGGLSAVFLSFCPVSLFCFWLDSCRPQLS